MNVALLSRSSRGKNVSLAAATAAAPWRIVLVKMKEGTHHMRLRLAMVTLLELLAVLALCR